MKTFIKVIGLEQRFEVKEGFGTVEKRLFSAADFVKVNILSGDTIILNKSDIQSVVVEGKIKVNNKEKEEVKK